jgi:hypothetical protein
MQIIVAKQGNKLYYGNLTKIAKLIKVHPSTIGRWIKSKKEIVFENKFEIYLNIEKL